MIAAILGFLGALFSEAPEAFEAIQKARSPEEAIENTRKVLSKIERNPAQKAIAAVEAERTK